MTVLYPQVARHSTLVPLQCDTEWTFTDRVLSDSSPTPAGAGAVQTAMQALNLSLNDAANLVASQGATNVQPAALVSHVTKVAGLAASIGPIPGMSGTYAGRIPIPSSVGIGAPLLAGDSTRVSLLIQNNNAAGGANLIVSIDGPVDTGNPAFFMNLVPGQGIFMDQNAWTNPIYVAWGSGAILGGVLFYGTNTSPASGIATGAHGMGAAGGMSLPPLSTSF